MLISYKVCRRPQISNEITRKWRGKRNEESFTQRRKVHAKPQKEDKTSLCGLCVNFAPLHENLPATSACAAREIYSPVILKSGKSKLWLSLFVDWEHLPAKS
jgi:hypothetical protein